MSIAGIGTPASAAGATGQTQPNAGSGTTSLNQNDFLQLLVAQLKYQNPMQPLNSTQFVTQLAQLQMLTELQAIRSDLDKLAAQQPANGGSAGGSTGSGSAGAAGTNAAAGALSGPQPGTAGTSPAGLTGG